MRKLYDEFLSLIDGGAIYERTLKLAALEQHQTTPYHHIVADLVLDELKKAGIPNAERIDIVADGKTAYQDKVMPLAWDATVGRLIMTTTAKNKWVPVSMRGMKLEEDPVIADFNRHPFHLVKGSTATPPGGIVAKVMNEAQFLAGDDPRGAMIMLEPTTRAGKGILKPILDQGALGFITDYMVGRYGEPDALQWVNAATESGNWHVRRRPVLHRFFGLAAHRRPDPPEGPCGRIEGQGRVRRAALRRRRADGHGADPRQVR